MNVWRVMGSLKVHPHTQGLPTGQSAQQEWGLGERSDKQAVSGLRNSFIHKPHQVSALPTTALSHPQATWTPHFFHSGIAGNHPAKCPKDPTEENMVERCRTGMWLLFNSDFLGAQSRWISPFTLKSFHLIPCQFSVFQNARDVAQ